MFVSRIALLAAAFNFAVLSLPFALAQTAGQGPGQSNYQPVPMSRNAAPSKAGVANPANPTGTASTTPVMAGLGAAAAPCVFTPVYSQNVRVEIYGTLANSTSGSGTGVIGKYGTGAAPANAATLVGTSWSPTVSGVSSAANAPEEFYVSGHLAGLVLGTAYWYDLGEAAITSGTASLTNVQCGFNEE